MSNQPIVVGKSIKSIITTQYFIELVQVADTKYKLVFGRYDEDKAHKFDLTDLRYALTVFDDVLIGLEGN